MPMAGYTKLFNSILASTIWEADMPTRIVWITLLAMADKHGVAEGSVPGLATFARVSLKDCQKALEALQSPDEHSRSKEYEGRRIEAIEGGWRLINHAKYRAKLGDDERREYLRKKQAEYRRRNAVSTNVNNVSEMSTALTHPEAEAKADTEAGKIKSIPRATRSAAGYSEDFLRFWEAYPRKTGKGEAAKAFARQKPSLEAVLSALKWQVNQPGWTKDGGQFIPHASTWLNQRRWEDEPFDPLPADPRHAPAGKETNAAYSIRSAQALLDEMDRADLEYADDSGPGDTFESLDSARPRHAREGREADVRRLPGRHRDD